MTLPILDLENSTIHGGLSITRDGEPTTIEDALTGGFIVSKDDANVILSMIARFVQNRDANHG